VTEEPGVGHNSEQFEGGQIAADEVRLIVERYERLEEEKKGILDDMKDVRAEAKARGYNPKMVLFLVKERAKDREKRAIERAEQETYLAALGLL